MSLAPSVSLAIVAAAALFAAAATRPAAAQTVPPDADWHAFETPHFRVSYSQGLEPIARRAAAVAERARRALAEDLDVALPATIDIVVSDHADFGNGFASVVPRNRIVLFARAPLESPALAFTRDWIELVVIHELTHVLHLETTGGLGRLIRRIFGRVSSGWPTFPQTVTPGWSIEGLATYYESRATGAGRVHGSFHDMVLRTATLEHAFDSIDRVSGSSPIWPAGDRIYIYGSRFLEHLSERFGDEVQARLVEEAATSTLPATLVFDRIAARATGSPFTTLYEEWRRTLSDRYHREAAALRRRGLTPTETLTEAGWWAAHPRVSPDGRTLAYAAGDATSQTATRLIDLDAGRIRDLARRDQFGNLLGPTPWLPDGSGLVLAQFQVEDTYRLWQDLYTLDLDGDTRRLTKGARLADPDVAPDGRRIAAVQTDDGRTRLVVFDRVTGDLRPITEYRLDVVWSLPRWSPDGRRLAAGRWERGRGLDIVLVQQDGTVTHMTRDAALDDAPAWSPDGRHLLFWSDRSGIPNVFAADVSGPGPGPLRQVTNVLTGAFDPEVSADGAWLYATVYHADGYHIERMPYDPGGWMDAAPPVQDFVPPRLEPDAVAGGSAVESEARQPQAAAVASPAAPYSPWPTLGPTRWSLTFDDEGAGQYFFGAETDGRDVLGIHEWGLELAYDFDQGWVEAAGRYDYAGLGNPLLSAELRRDWSRLGLVRLEDDGGTDDLFRRTDRAALSTSVLRRRYRSSAGIAAGGEVLRERLELLRADALIGGAGTLTGAFIQPFYSDTRSYPYSISREDGISTFVTLRRLWDLDPAGLDGTFTQLSGRLSAFHGFPLFGFANHVLAGRVSGLLRAGSGASVVGVGGASGTAETVLVTDVGGPALFLPVRGFDEGARRGTRAWSGSLEYRLPIALVGKGLGLLPVFLDRVAATAFVDAGHAWCTAAQREALGPACQETGAGTLLSAGGEILFDVHLFFRETVRARLGLATPLNPGGEPSLYFRFGSAF